MSLHSRRYGTGQSRQSQQGGHDVRRGKHQVVQTWLDLTGEADDERYIHGLGERRVLRIIRMLAAHRFTMIGRENNDCILIQPQLLQSIEYLPESAVNARNRSKVVTRTLRLCHFRIGVGTDQQTVQRPVFVEVEVLLHTVVQRTVRTMRRVHTYHDEKRLFTGRAHYPHSSDRRQPCLPRATETIRAGRGVCRPYPSNGGSYAHRMCRRSTSN